MEIPEEVGVMTKGLLLETGEVGSVGLSGQIARVEMMSPCWVKKGGGSKNLLPFNTKNKFIIQESLESIFYW